MNETEPKGKISEAEWISQNNGQCFCAFIDLLGFKEILSDFDRACEIYRHICLEAGFHKTLLGAPYSQFLNSILRARPPPKIVIISDSIVITSIYWHEVIMVAREIQKYLFSQQILVRGGIGFGRHADFGIDGSVAVVSEALSLAYVAESRLALYPRIVIDKSALSEISRYTKLVSNAPLLNQRKFFVVDDASCWFLSFDFLNDKVDTSSFLYRKYKSATSESVRQKLRWVIDYFHFIGQFKQNSMEPTVKYVPEFRFLAYDHVANTHLGKLDDLFFIENEWGDENK